MSIKIIDVFVRLREALSSNAELRLAIEQIKRKTENNTKSIEVVFLPIAIGNLDELLEKKENPKPRNPIGYKTAKKKSN